MTYHRWSFAVEKDVDLTCEVFRCDRCGARVPAKGLRIGADGDLWWDHFGDDEACGRYEGGSHSENCDEQVVRAVMFE